MSNNPGTRGGRVHRVSDPLARVAATSGGLQSSGLFGSPVVERKSALRSDDKTTAGDNNADAVTPAANDTGEPHTPSEADPHVADPSHVVPENRDDEEVEAVGEHTETKEGAGMDWFDQLGS